MRIRIDSDNAKKVNAARKKNGAEGKPLSAHQEVNKALAAHYAGWRINPEFVEVSERQEAAKKIAVAAGWPDKGIIYDFDKGLRFRVRKKK